MALKPLEVLAVANAFTKATVEGAGAVAGKPCQIQSITDITGGHRITFLWEDNAGASHTSTMDVMDGEDGATPAVSVTPITGGHRVTFTTDGVPVSFDVMDGAKGDTGATGPAGADGAPGADGEPGADGFSPTITVKSSTSTEYILTITTAEGSYDTPNLKGSGGGGGVSKLSELDDVTLTSLSTGQILKWNGSAWVNADGVEIDSLSDIADVDISNLQSGQMLRYNAARAKWENITLEVANISDIVLTNVQNGQTLVYDSTSGKWVNADAVNPTQFSAMPTAGDHPQEVIQYTGADTADYKRGYFYRSTPVVVSGELTYVWQQIDTQPSNNDYDAVSNKPAINGTTLQGDKTSSQLSLQDIIQYATLPEASASLLGKIYQYIGATTADYKKGFFYQCVYDSENSAYVWQKTDVSDNSALAGRVTTLETNQGNIGSLEVTGVTDLVSAINKVNAKAGITRYEYNEPNLIIYYNDGSTFQIAVSSILSETQIGELANVLDSTIADGNVLQYDSALQKYKPYAILAALQACLSDAKDYTDTEIASAIVAGAYVCDEKPSYDAEHDTVIYKQGGTVKTTTQTDARFYYYVSGDPFCSSWIDDTEFTFSVADVDFDDYVNKNTDVVSTYTEDMLDKSKVPDVAALDALLAIVKTALAAKVNTADIIDGLTSSDATKPLSAKQGKVLKDAVDTKQDIIQYSTMPTADQPYLGKVAQYVGATGLAYTKGSFYECKYDNDTTTYYWSVCEMTAELGTLSDGETKPVSGDAIYDALALKQDKALSSPVESQSTVEGALTALSTNKQASTLSTTIEGESTVEGALTALSNKSVGVDGTTIVKDQTTGELSAVTATNNSVGVVTDGDGTSIGANGEVNVVNRLEEISALPTASASNEGKFYLLTGTQSGYQTGGTYACEEITPATDPKTYHWVLKSANPLTFNSDNFTVANDEVSLKAGYKKIYVGTKADWDLLTTAEKIEFDEAHFTGDEGAIPSDVYSTTETKTNKVWIDGKPIYRKVINVGALPSTAGDKTVLHNISNVDHFISCEAFHYSASGLHLFTTYAPAGSNDSDITMAADKTTIYVTVGVDRSGYSTYVILEYTKTTD